MTSNRAVISRVRASMGWLVALLALIGVAKLEGPALDIYIHDTYLPVSKSQLMVLILLLLVLPLVAMGVRVFRSGR